MPRLTCSQLSHKPQTLLLSLFRCSRSVWELFRGYEIDVGACRGRDREVLASQSGLGALRLHKDNCQGADPSLSCSSATRRSTRKTKRVSFFFGRCPSRLTVRDCVHQAYGVRDEIHQEKSEDHEPCSPASNPQTSRTTHQSCLRSYRWNRMDRRQCHNCETR